MVRRRRPDLLNTTEPVVKALFLRFCEKFGREPQLDDPLFFDPCYSFRSAQSLSFNTWLAR